MSGRTVTYLGLHTTVLCPPQANVPAHRTQPTNPFVVARGEKIKRLEGDAASCLILWTLLRFNSTPLTFDGRASTNFPEELIAYVECPANVCMP